LERGQGSEIFHNLAQLAIDELTVNHGGFSPQKALNTNPIQSAQMRNIGMPFGCQHLEGMKDTRYGFE